MEKFKKFLVGLIISLSILLVTVGFPTIAYTKYYSSQYYTLVDFNGSKVASTFSNLVQLMEKKADPTLLSNLVKDYSNIIVGTSKDLLNLFFVTSIILGVSIIVTGLIMMKMKKKIPAVAFIISGLLSISSYILMYYISISTLTAV